MTNDTNNPGDDGEDDGLTPEQRGLAIVGAKLAEVVEGVLAPALVGKRVRSCLHILDANHERLRREEAVESEQTPMICPMHPERMLCSKPDCLRMHLAAYHRHDMLDAKCFVCEATMWDEIAKEFREDFTGVTAIIQLHKQVPFNDDVRGRDRWFVFRGSIETLPAAYLCSLHDDLVQLPIKMAWPTGGADVRPEDVAG